MSAAYLKAPEALPSVRIPFWCAGKAAFESAVLAHAAATRRGDRPREHYRCRSCGKFHVGAVGSNFVSHGTSLGLIR